ncbi:TonB family protein [Parvularcula maris]|uniref:Protein TonB n=1 Tax=Parvularcula maris TaxID=2965077 RepID=A0A9X2L7N0_9PROT|nr:TonB family protein [Parvularcula maris]MCQ8184542.1 TonB family protein [Parvularcula maris]
MSKTKNAARASIPAAAAAVFLGSMSFGTAFAEEPAIIKAIAPDYPRAAERRDLEGHVIVSIDVDGSGAVTAVNVVSAEPAGIFEGAATRAVQRWKFEAGKPATGIVKKVAFKMEG